MGTEITVTASPSEGYIVKEVTVECETLEDPVVVSKESAPDNTYKFTMPADNVTVTAVFIDKPFDDRPPADSDPTARIALVTNSGQTMQDGKHSYSYAPGRMATIGTQFTGTNKINLSLDFSI